MHHSGLKLAACLARSGLFVVQENESTWQSPQVLQRLRIASATGKPRGVPLIAGQRMGDAQAGQPENCGSNQRSPLSAGLGGRFPSQNK